MAFDYYAGGSGEEWTLRENRAAFHRWVLRPRVLIDVGERDTATTVLGEPVAFPILAAPPALVPDPRGADPPPAHGRPGGRARARGGLRRRRDDHGALHDRLGHH